MLAEQWNSVSNTKQVHHQGFTVKDHAAVISHRAHRKADNGGSELSIGVTLIQLTSVCRPQASPSLLSKIFLEPMVSIRFIVEWLYLDEPSSLVEALCFNERAVGLQSQDQHSARRGFRRQSF